MAEDEIIRQEGEGSRGGLPGLPAMLVKAIRVEG